MPKCKSDSLGYNIVVLPNLRFREDCKINPLPLTKLGIVRQH